MHGALEKRETILLAGFSLEQFVLEGKRYSEVISGERRQERMETG